MPRRSAFLSGSAVAAALGLVLAGLGAIGAAASPGAGPAAATPAAPEHVMAAPPPGEWVPVDPPVAGIPPQPDVPWASHHEFQANCSVDHTAPDDPIVYPDDPGASHDHTFMGNTTTDAHSSLGSLRTGGTTCKVPADLTAYWMPTMYDGDREIRPIGDQVIYYKAGVTDFRTVRPFPPGLRYVVGSPYQSEQEFIEGSVEGWECGDSFGNSDIPDSCAPGSQLNVRYQAPSCWDGRHLDSPDHKAHMAYPVWDGELFQYVCPESHPVAVPMIEFKMAFPAGSDTSNVTLSSGPGYSFHYDVFNAWDEPTLAALVAHCINGGLQCDARGFDQYHPERGAALDENYELP
ncbi:DUF1996 domain-containing protein [Streptomyces hoynatensis]|uniref:DUF1996 domain-containing protein n=1 Tax=Streptomyces hoynatensis TaxID=1141874 RepID=A0A3A9YL71_9ACTN|nr:DUF1996 domain-containing protein [Streptomyces hoynatensis]RKN37215.1 DUF1996 domain-containing protein [Streptomyces hoynatensis]